MTRCIAFLRAINVGGRTVKMDTLRTTFEALGLTHAQTYIASGNVIFDTRARDLAALERRIETTLHETFGFEIHTFVRSVDDLQAALDHPAFDAAATASAATHVIGFLVETPADAAHAVLAKLASDADRLQLHGRELHWLSTHKQSESTFSNAAFERALKTRTTFRNITTLKKLLALARPT